MASPRPVRTCCFASPSILFGKLKEVRTVTDADGLYSAALDFARDARGYILVDAPGMALALAPIDGEDQLGRLGQESRGDKKRMGILSWPQFHQRVLSGPRPAIRICLAPR